MHFRSTIGAEPGGYNLSYSSLFKMILCFKLRKKCCKKVSGFKVWPSLSFSKLEVSEIISRIVLS